MKLGKYDFINEDEVMRLLPMLEEYDGELPLVLIDYINPIGYLNRVSDDVVTGFYERRHDIQIVENPLDYLKHDLKEWLKTNKEYSNILIE